MKASSMNDKQLMQRPRFLGNLKQGIWLLGLAFGVFGIVDRSIASFSDGLLSAFDLMQLLIVAALFISWLFLKPNQQLEARESGD